MIKTYTWQEKLPEVKRILDEKYPGWQVSDLLTPGKAWHHTLLLNKDGQKKIVHLDTKTFVCSEGSSMLDKLANAMKQLPVLLENRSNWDSLIVNRRKPHTYRVFTYLPDGCRICLHKFNPCDTHEAFLHPHPWSGAFIVLSGRYLMEVAYSTTREAMPEHVMKLELTEGSKYEITSPLTWHSVTPLEVTYTVMVNEPSWDANVAHKDVKTTKGKDLDKMPEEELKEHLDVFRNLVGYYNGVFGGKHV